MIKAFESVSVIDRIQALEKVEKKIVIRTCYQCRPPRYLHTLQSDVTILIKYVSPQ